MYTLTSNHGKHIIIWVATFNAQFANGMQMQPNVSPSSTHQRTLSIVGQFDDVDE
jgi:hypothetical protein